MPCLALNAEYRVFTNGTAYNASIDLVNADRFEFSDMGVLGERIPLKVSNIALSGNCSPCTFNMSGAFAVTFKKGNYTIAYTAPLKDFHLQAVFEKPYTVYVSIPPEFDVRNPLIAGISPGATISSGYNNSTTVQWNQTTSLDLRFYDRNRENLLYLFGNFWLVIAIVLLVPFLLTIKRKE